MKFTGYEAPYLEGMIDSNYSAPFEAFTKLVLKDNPDIRVDECQKLYSETLNNIKDVMKIALPHKSA